VQQEEQAAKQDTRKDAKKGKEQPGTEGGTAGKAAAKNDQNRLRTAAVPPRLQAVFTPVQLVTPTQAAAGRTSTTNGAATNSKGAAAGGKLEQVEVLDQQLETLEAIQRRSHVVRPLRRKRKPTKPLHLGETPGLKAAQTAKRQNLRPRHPKKTT